MRDGRGRLGQATVGCAQAHASPATRQAGSSRKAGRRRLATVLPDACMSRPVRRVDSAPKLKLWDQGPGPAPDTPRRSPFSRFRDGLSWDCFTAVGARSPLATLRWRNTMCCATGAEEVPYAD